MAISFFGQTWVPATDNASTPLGSATPHTITPPSSMVAGQFVLVAVTARNNTTPTVSETGGQTWSNATANTNGSTIITQLFWCIFNGTWSADPSFTTGSTSDGICAKMSVFGGVDNSSPFDVSPTAIDFSSATSKTLTAFTTGVNNALAGFIWGEPDDNVLSGQDSGWTGADGSTGSLHDHVGNQGGSDIGLFESFKSVATAGSTGSSNVVALDTADVGAGFYFSLKPAVAPTVTTSAVTSIGPTIATGNGNVTSDGNSPITERGVVVNTSGTPTTSDLKFSTSGTTGSFTAFISGLSLTTTYYVRAYAINAAGTSYGSEVTFDTTGAPTAYGPRAGTSSTNLDLFATGKPWTNAGNVLASDDTYATRGSLGSNVYTDLLCVTGFDFSDIPDGSVITGFKVTVERKASLTDTCRDGFLYLTKDGATNVSSTNIADTATNYTTSDVSIDHGSDTELFGVTWTTAEIKDSDFGVLFGARQLGIGGSPTVSVDYIELMIYAVPAASGVVIPVFMNQYRQRRA